MKLFRDFLLLLVPFGIVIVVQSIDLHDEHLSLLGICFLALGLIGSFLPVHMRWGKYGTWWYIVAYPGKYMPVYIFFRAVCTAISMTCVLAYAYITNLGIPGFLWLQNYYFLSAIVLGGITITMIVMHARAYPHWYTTLDYIFRKQ